jgi:hypothetical protein
MDSFCRHVAGPEGVLVWLEFTMTTLVHVLVFLPIYEVYQVTERLHVHVWQYIRKIGSAVLPASDYLRLPR